MSTSLKVAEVIVRLVVIIFQILGIIGGALLIRLTSNDTSNNSISTVHGIGGTAIALGGLVLIYEVIMIAMSFVEGLNHSARLLVVSTICCIHQEYRLAHINVLSGIF